MAKAGESIGTIEAVKTVAEIYAPISGEIVAVNTALSDSAAIMNSDPYGDGWIVKIKLADLAELDGLLDAQGYAAHIA